jgi:hypothetical protein
MQGDAMLRAPPSPAERSARLLALVLALTAPVACAVRARAAATADVVDDSDVETPGVCHLETWTTRFQHAAQLIDLSPACTRKAWPRLELGAGFQHLWDTPAATQAGPTLKLNLRQADQGVGVGLIGTANWSLRDGGFETGSLILAVSVGKRVRLNLNGGELYLRTERRRHGVFYGAQVEGDVGSNVSLMAEVFGRDHGRPGGQARVRWTPGGGRMDFDLLGGSLNGRAGEVTVALTVRR